MTYASSVHAKAVELTRLSIEMTSEAGSGHPTSAASLAHLVTVLMYDHMRYDPRKPERIDVDRLVLSEGHACPIVYAAAADLGITIESGGVRRPMTRDDALTLRSIDSPIDGHPNPAEGFPFFPAATGSLGQGLSIAAGLAIAARLDGRDSRFFCLVGDGESREGQNWEALDFICDHDLGAVCPIFNCNGYGQTGTVSSRQGPRSLAAKLEGSGFEAIEIDGHDPEQVRAALQRHAQRSGQESGRPLAIVARTVKGWGFSDVIEGGMHGSALEGEQKQAALEALDTTAERIGAEWKLDDLAIEVPDPGKGKAPSKATPPPTLIEALERFGANDALEGEKLATRKAYGYALRAIGLADERIVVLDGDVSNSTYAQTFAEDDELRYRFFECRIAEQNMVSCAAGLAAAGKRPFTSSFGKFVTRAHDQLEMALVGRLPIDLVGSHVGVSLAADGPSQMALPDVAFFRSFTMVRDEKRQPMMYVLQPADAHAAYHLALALAEHEGSCYLRTLRPDVPLLYAPEDRFTLGEHRIVEDGDDLVIFASGYMVHEALAARALLHERGVFATLVDLYSLPFDENAIRSLVAEHHGRVLTVEDNYGGGIGSAVLDALAGHGQAFELLQMNVQRIPKSGRTPESVLGHLGLSAEDIAEKAQELISSVALGS